MGVRASRRYVDFDAHLQRGDPGHVHGNLRVAAEGAEEGEDVLLRLLRATSRATYELHLAPLGITSALENLRSER